MVKYLIAITWVIDHVDQAFGWFEGSPSFSGWFCYGRLFITGENYLSWMVRRSVITYPKGISDIRNDIRKVISETLTSDIRNICISDIQTYCMTIFHIRKVGNKVGLAWCHYPLQSPDDPIKAYCYRRSVVIDCRRSGTFDGPTYQLINNQFLASKESWVPITGLISDIALISAKRFRIWNEV